MGETLERMIFTIDLSQGQVRTGGGNGKPLEPGYYRVRIADCGKHNDTSVRFVCEVTEGEFAGNNAWVFIGTDGSKLGIQNAWKTALASMGFDASKAGADTGIDTDLFIDKPAYLRVLPNRDDATKTDRSLITEEEYLRKTQTQTTGMTVTSVPQQVVAAPKINAPRVTAPQPSVAAAKLTSWAAR